MILAQNAGENSALTDRPETVRTGVSDPALLTYALRLADTALILGHRLSQWVGRAPVVEEDLALGNMGLDLIGQARAGYGYAAELEASGRDEDALAYLRDDTTFLNMLMVELPNGDFAFTMLRQFLYAAFAQPFFAALAGAADATLGGIAAKAEKEMAYHLRHAAEWVIRLGDGTAESHARAQRALDDLWPFTGELFEADAIDHELALRHIAAEANAMRSAWSRTVQDALAQATLTRPPDGWMQSGGRSGRHTEHLGPLLADMQALHRAHPGASW